MNILRRVLFDALVVAPLVAAFLLALSAALPWAFAAAVVDRVAGRRRP